MIAAASSVLPCFRGRARKALRCWRSPPARVLKRPRTMYSCHGRRAKGTPEKSPVWLRRFMKTTGSAGALPAGLVLDTENVLPGVISRRVGLGLGQLGRLRAESEIVQDAAE